MIFWWGRKAGSGHVSPTERSYFYFFFILKETEAINRYIDLIDLCNLINCFFNWLIWLIIQPIIAAPRGFNNHELICARQCSLSFIFGNLSSHVWPKFLGRKAFIACSKNCRQSQVVATGWLQHPTVFCHWLLFWWKLSSWKKKLQRGVTERKRKVHLTTPCSIWGCFWVWAGVFYCVLSGLVDAFLTRPF